MGFSGLGWGYEDFNGVPKRKVDINPQLNEKNGDKVWQRDILAVYGEREDYPSLDEKLSKDLKPLFLLDSGGKVILQGNSGLYN